MTSASTQDTRIIDRVLHLIAGARARHLPADDAAVLVFERGPVRRFKIDTAILDALIGEGLLARADDGGLALTALGAARLARQRSDHGFRAQHGGLVPLEAGDGARDVAQGSRVAPGRRPAPERRPMLARDESPLALIAHRRDRDGRAWIEPVHVVAGDRLRADFTRGQMTPRVTSDWSALLAPTARSSGRGGMADLSDTALAARGRVRRAIEAVGPELQGVLLDVCCFLKGLEQIEAERRWPARSAKVVLRLALDCLARHYGLAAEARGPETGRLRAARAE
jgi:hypothetical protein